jgi:hypothetical protein
MLLSCFYVLASFLALTLLFANLMRIGDKYSSFSFFEVYLHFVWELSAKLMRLLGLFDLGELHSSTFI